MTDEEVREYRNIYSNMMRPPMDVLLYHHLITQHMEMILLKTLHPEPPHMPTTGYINHPLVVAGEAFWIYDNTLLIGFKLGNVFRPIYNGDINREGEINRMLWSIEQTNKIVTSARRKIVWGYITRRLPIGLAKYLSTFAY